MRIITKLENDNKSFDRDFELEKECGLADDLTKWFLSDPFGCFNLYGANVCFHSKEEQKVTFVYFPFKCFVFTFKKIIEDPEYVLEVLIKYIQKLTAMENKENEKNSQILN